MPKKGRGHGRGQKSRRKDWGEHQKSAIYIYIYTGKCPIYDLIPAVNNNQYCTTFLNHFVQRSPCRVGYATPGRLDPAEWVDSTQLGYSTSWRPSPHKHKIELFLCFFNWKPASRCPAKTNLTKFVAPSLAAVVFKRIKNLM